MYTSQQTCSLWLLLGVSTWAAFRIAPGTTLPPVSWFVISLCVWLAYAVLRPDRRRDKAVLWGALASFLFCSFLAQDLTFRTWGDVYFFCGPKMQYCTCNFRWNIAGWYKAFVLWNFVLSTALGVQRLIIQLGLCGLLPGEEVVTRESYISICWRLIPYWLNNWEQQWGAECSSVMFDLPHFAVELLIILPCVQILCSRMKVLAMPSVSAALPPGRDNRPEVVRQECVPNVLRGCWERQPQQKHIWHRIRANKHIISFSCLLCLMAGFNALYIPLHLEDLILQHPDAAVMQVSGRLPPWQDLKALGKLQEGLKQGDVSFVDRTAVHQEAAAAGPAAGLAAMLVRVSLGQTQPEPEVDLPVEAVGHLFDKVSVYRAEPLQCPDIGRLKSNMRKHHGDITRMQEPEHRMSVPLVDAALALMRLSTEKFFVLLSLFVTFLVFRIPPQSAAYLIRLNARISSAFARLIVYSFPAVCWSYGAGFVFSTFVSVVFWGAPLLQLYEYLRSNICSVSIKSLRPATAPEIERMHGDCAICWGEMAVVPAVHAATVVGTAVRSSTGIDTQPQVAAAEAAAVDGPEQQGGVQMSCVDNESPANKDVVQQPPAVPGLQVPIGAEAANNLINQSKTAAVGVACAGAELVSPFNSSAYGHTLPCGHAYHSQCLNQWLQQCHTQGVTPKCPMCQAPMQLNKQWHIFGPRRQPADEQQPRDHANAEAANNYLLQYNPRLADMLADMPNILAQENVQLLAEVQDLRIQRQQLVGELQLRQQQLQELAGRQQQMELEGMEMDQQRRQLLDELQMLRLARDRQRQLQQESAASAHRVASGSSTTGVRVGSTEQQSNLGSTTSGTRQFASHGPGFLDKTSAKTNPCAPAAEVGGLMAADLSAEGMHTKRMRLLQRQLDEILGEEVETGGREARAMGRWSTPSGLRWRTAAAACGRSSQEGAVAGALLHDKQEEAAIGVQQVPSTCSVGAAAALADDCSGGLSVDDTVGAAAASEDLHNQHPHDS